jgi:hypothetical protein
MDLLGLDETRNRLKVVGQSYGGVQEIPVDRIVGSLDRTADFDRSFRPRRGFSRTRLAGLRAAFPDGAMPPIEVHEIGGAYFVADGHHRVALARERGMDFLDAEVTRLETNYDVGPDVDARTLVHTEQQRIFGEESGMAAARPDVVVEFSRPGGYPELLELVKAHGYDLGRRLGRLPTAEEVATDWCDHVFLPGVEALRGEALPEAYAYKTDSDLFLWIYQRRRALRVTDAATDFEAAARDALGQRVSRSFRRAFLREKSRPLPRRRNSP